MRDWFGASFAGPTRAQELGWPAIVSGASTLLLAPTGSGKTLAAFLTSIDRLMFNPAPPAAERLRVLYISPLKALGVDVERNLRAPLAGIAAQAERAGAAFHLPSVGVRSGDTPARERAQLSRHPPDILITTPESLFLLLTSRAREVLRSVETVIVDEIHSLVPTKRGAHLFLSLERLEGLRAPGAKPLQRIGLSATQRPLDEVARLLGGGTVEERDAASGFRLQASGKATSAAAGTSQPEARSPQPEASPPEDPPSPVWRQRPVTIIDAGAKKQIELRVEVPVEDMSRLGELEELPSGNASAGPKRRSIWPSIHPRLLELIRENRSTMIFVNSRRLAERLAGALNELAQGEVALAHHGSVAKEKRAAMEDSLKRGTLPCIVATSSLELGIDMGAVDLVVQIEAPPSIASGLQRLGRARHQVGGVPRGVLFPKHRGDLLAAAAASLGMTDGLVEATFYPRNPLDVLAQQIVAIAASHEGPLSVEDLLRTVRGAAPFAELPRGSFEGVLDMLSGRYPSDEFAELKARVTWDRIAGTLCAREGAGRIAIVNAGTIPDRGLYGVFIAGGDEKTSRRVGELDEEMVFETRTGDVFVLGASSWRVEEITHDRVLVTPAPGEPGKMPFWHGDRPGRPLEFGERVGKLSRELSRATPAKAAQRLREECGLDDKAAQNLLAYLRDQREATGEVPSDQSLVVERYVDEVGDFRVCVLSPFGARVHAPWATAVTARLKAERGDADIESLWSDDGMVFRLPGSDTPPEPELFFPAPDEIEEQVVQALSGTSLFAARFRENAARALLLPRRFPGKRSPLWAQRKRAADLLSVAQRYGSFPILLETYRECLRDVFDLPGLVELLRRVRDRRVRVHTVDSRVASPFASSLLFAYVANFIYDGDAPLAERRAQALSVDQAQLRELLGEAELRELLDADAIAAHEQGAQRLDRRYPPKHADGLHDLLLALGDLSEAELRERCADEAPLSQWLDELISARRALRVQIAGAVRIIAAEDVARFRDALGLVPPAGLPQELLEPVKDPLGDLLSRYARTHGPFRAEEAAGRFGLGIAPVLTTLQRLQERERVLEGEFLPRSLASRHGGAGREWCDAEVLRALKRRSLSRLRKQVEPVDHAALARFSLDWQGVLRPRRGVDALLSAVEQLQGAPLPASALEREVLPARIAQFRSSDLDLLFASGELIWRGVEPLGTRDGRVAVYLTDHFRLLAPPPVPAPGELCARLRKELHERGASFFADLQRATGAFATDLLAALWDLVWAGEVTNDTLAPLRSFLRGPPSNDGRRGRREEVSLRGFRSRRTGPPGSEGRWSLLPAPSGTPTERAAALAQVLLARYGVLAREAAHAEGIAGGFSAVYGVLKAMEEAGRARRGYFVAGLGATQFAQPGAEERLRAVREPAGDGAGSGPDGEPPAAWILAATDPANPYGATLPWPEVRDGAARPQRAAGAQVVLYEGHLVAALLRGEHQLLSFLPADEPLRSQAARALAAALAAQVDEGRRKALLVARVDGEDVARSPLAPFLAAAGFTPGIKGYLKRAPLDAPFRLAATGLHAPKGPMRGPLGPDVQSGNAPRARRYAPPPELGGPAPSEPPPVQNAAESYDEPDGADEDD